MPLFHASPVILGPGSTIHPGNWGRLVRSQRISEGGGFRTYLGQELVYELVRLREFPGHISRLEAAYAFEDRAHAEEFGIAKKSVVYEVELVDKGAQWGRYGMELVKFPTLGQLVIPVWEELARAYWSTKQVSRPEILTLSPLRVARRVA